MNENYIQRKLKEAYDASQPARTSSFNETWASAKARFERSQHRYRVIGGIAAAVAVIGLAIGLWPARQAEFDDDYLIADALLNSTSWSAPSDMLMPEHQFDIYREIPFLIESTNSQEGSLL